MYTTCRMTEGLHFGTGVIYLFRLILRVNTYYSPHSISLWTLIAYTGCVLCEV